MRQTKFAMALILAAAAAPALAQSSVTIFGVVDARLMRGSGSVASRTSLGNSGMVSSSLVFMGVEDLGDGKYGGFFLDMGLNNDDGSGQGTTTNNQTAGVSASGGLAFNRRSTVSLGGSWGEIRLGRDYSPQYWNLTWFDPFGTIGTGANIARDAALPLGQAGLAGPSVRASNSISYAWGHSFNNQYAFGEPGFHALAQYYLGENPSNAANAKDGTGAGIRVGYNSGPASVALALSKTSYATGDAKQNNLGGSYNFGVARVLLQYTRDALGPVNGKGGLLGLIVPVGSTQLKASYGRYRSDAVGSPGADKLTLGAVYNFSKRTAIYATVARVNNKGSATFALNGAITAAGNSSTGVDFGIKHSF